MINTKQPLPFGMDDHLSDEQHARNFLRRFEYEYKVRKFPVEHSGQSIESGTTATRPSVNLKFHVWKGRYCKVTQGDNVLFEGRIRDFDAKLAYMEMS